MKEEEWQSNELKRESMESPFQLTDVQRIQSDMFSLSQRIRVLRTLLILLTLRHSFSGACEARRGLSNWREFTHKLKLTH